MKTATLCAAVLSLLCWSVATHAAGPSVGAIAFEENCAGCHPGGGNPVNPAKNLRVMTLKANGITTPKDIVAKMRKPGPGMTRFTTDEIPDQKALEIARYILSTFK